MIIPKENDELAQEKIEQIILEHMKEVREELPSYQQIQKSYFLWQDQLPKKEDGEIDRHQVKKWLAKYIAETKSSETLKDPVDAPAEIWNGKSYSN